MSDGHVLVDAGARRRIYLLDSTLSLVKIVRDSGVGTASIIGTTIRLIPYTGDSSLLADVETRAMSVLDERGTTIRTIAPPRPADMLKLLSGHAALDPKGRLIYLTPGSISRGAPDSAPLVRGDFETRSIDTVGWLHGTPDGWADFTAKESPSGQEVHVFSMMLNPFAREDQWAMISDGSIAMVRVQDYHIDWIEPDGRRRSTPKMPLDWRAYTDSEQKTIADSVLRQAEDHQRKSSAVATDGRGAGRPAPAYRNEISMIPEREFPTYWPPIQRGSVIADLEDHLWILPTTSKNAVNGPTYDVIDRDGRILRREQLPKGRIVFGFGARDIVYLMRIDGPKAYLEAYRKT